MSTKDYVPLIPPLTTVVVGLIVVVLVPALRLSRTLRRDLAEDAKIVVELPKAAQREFRTEMGERSILLTAYSKYSATTRVEVGAALLVVLLAASSLAMSKTLAEPVTNYFDMEAWMTNFILAAFGVGAASVALSSWYARTSERLLFLDRYASDSMRREVGNSTILTVVFVQAAARLLVIGPLIATYFIILNRGWPYTDKVQIGTAIINGLIIAGSSYSSWRFLRVPSDLAEQLPDPMWAMIRIFGLTMAMPDSEELARMEAVRAAHRKRKAETRAEKRASRKAEGADGSKT